jgi:hypothetical protein
MAGTNKQREEINRKLVSMQMEMIGLTYEDAMNTPEFWKIFTLTTEQRNTWHKQALVLVKKTFKINATKARSIIDFFELTLGLRVYDPIEPEDTVFPLPPPPIEIVFHPEAYLLEKTTVWQKIKNFFKL